MRRSFPVVPEQGLAWVLPEGHTLFTARAAPLASTSAASIAAASIASVLK